jgi:glyoxylase-like metal-dependent hydrolase (beta-lactamase superfamily II)
MPEAVPVEAAPVEVGPGVWWLSGTRGCNVYLARASDGTFVIVDAGFRGNAPAIVAGALAVLAGAPGSRVTHVLLTHAHFDHTGAAAEVARALDARIALGVGDCERRAGGGWQSVPMMRRRPPPARRFGKDAPPETVPVDIAIEGRCEIAPGIEAIPAPGHTPGSTCFVARDAGVAFVGDLVISYPDGLARSMVAANRDDRRYLETLGAFAREARALNVTMGLPGHGHPIRAKFAASLEELSTLPREPLTPRNFLRRAKRMARFNAFMWLKDRPRR